MKTSLTDKQVAHAGEFWARIWNERNGWEPTPRAAAQSIKCLGKIRAFARSLFENGKIGQIGEDAIAGFDELVYLDTLRAIYELGVSCGMEILDDDSYRETVDGIPVLSANEWRPKE